MLPPKVASRSLILLASSYPHEYGLNIAFRGHLRLDQLDEFLPKNKKNYTIYSFYRDPVERFKSLYKYCVLATTHNISIYKNLTISSFISILEKSRLTGRTSDLPMIDLGDPQIEFMDENTVLFDVKNIDTDICKLQSAWGLPIKNIKKINTSGNALISLRDSELERVKELYSMDYAFFESKGIYL